MTALHLPPGQNYACTQCGKSCTMFHEVEVEPRSRAAVEAIDYRSVMRPEAGDSSPFLQSVLQKSRTILRKHGKTCVFQEPGGLCGIHAKFGPEHKPQTCHDFPYRYVETPGGTYVGLSYACTAVQQNSGPAVAAQGEYLEAARTRSNNRLERTATVRLTHRHELAWDAYLALEDDLRAILHLPEATLADRLTAQACYIDVFVRFLREVRGDSPDAVVSARNVEVEGRFAPNFGQQDVAVLAHVRERFLARDGAELLRLARRLRPSPMLQRAFLGLVTAFRNALEIKISRTPPGRFITTVRIVRHYLAHGLRLGRIGLDALDGRFDYDAFRRIKYPVDEDAALRELADRFIAHALFRKDLLLAENVWLGHRLLLMHVALVRWHAVGLAALAARPAITRPVLEEAIGHVERYYSYHTSFAKLFQDLPLLGTILDSIVGKPGYAPAMMGSPV